MANNNPLDGLSESAKEFLDMLRKARAEVPELKRLDTATDLFNKSMMALQISGAMNDFNNVNILSSYFEQGVLIINDIMKGE